MKPGEEFGPELDALDNLDGWLDLKTRFHENCPNPDEWVIDEHTHTIYSKDGTTGVTSTVYPFWRNRKDVTWSKS